MRGAFALILLFVAALFAVTRYDPDAGNRILIEPVEEPDAPAFYLQSGTAVEKRYSGVMDYGNLPSILPPERFMGSAGVLTFFLTKEEITKACGDDNLACVIRSKDGGTFMVLPNTCELVVSRVEIVAAILCHELGHVNGWPGEHGP